MTTTQAQQAAQEFDFQTAFLEAATNRQIQITVGSKDAGTLRTIQLRRWSLTQQMQLGHSMGVVLNTIATGLARHLKLDADGEVTIKLDEIINQSLVLMQVMEQCSDPLFRVIVGSIAPNFNNATEAQEYAESLDLADAVQLVMLIVKHNSLTEEAKKKLSNLAAGIPSLSVASQPR